jgi:predicted RNase H-like HicB family nuclease
MAQRQYLVIIEPSATGYGAYVPDVPGCVAVGETRAEVEQMIREALEAHLELMLEMGEPIQGAVSEAFSVNVRLPTVQTR